MKNTKQILTTLLTVVISVSLVSAVAYGATTVGNNVQVGGTLISVGAFSVNGNATTTAAGAISTESTLTVAGASTLTGTLTTKRIYINLSESTGVGLKAHSHDMLNDADESTTANEFKSDTLLTTSGFTGLYSDAIRNASGTAAITGIMGLGYAGTEGVNSTGGNVIGVNGGADVSGSLANPVIVNGAAITVAGVVGGIMPMLYGTITKVKDITALWGSSNLTEGKAPLAGDLELLLLSTGTGETIPQAIKIDGSDAGDRITNFVKFSNLTSGMVVTGTSLMSAASATISSDGYIKIKVDATTYYIPIYDTTM